jgi:hypothetical protein
LSQILLSQALRQAHVSLSSDVKQKYEKAVVRGGEEDLSAESRLQLLGDVKLGAVVRGDGANRMGLPGQDLGGALQCVLAASGGQLADARQPAFAFHHRHHTGFAPAVNRVDLPVSDTLAFPDLGRTLRDHLLAREASAAVVSAMALPALFARASQMHPERPALRFIRPNPPVARIVAHRLYPFQGQPTHDLIGLRSAPSIASIGAKCSAP